MSNLVEKATDARQTPQWAKFMQTLAWEAHQIHNTQIFVRPIKPFAHSLIKIQHTRGELPLEEIDALAKLKKALFVAIEPGPLGYNEESFKKNGYIKSVLSTSYSANILVDIAKSPDQLLSSFSENARRNIRKGEKNKLKIKTVFLKDQTDSTAIQEFYELHAKVSKMKGFYIHPYNEIEAKMEAFKERGLLIFAYEENDPKPIGAIWFGCVDQTLLYINTGISKRGYDLLANYILLWEGLKLAESLKVTVLDFEGIYDERNPKENKKWVGFTEFKKRFHGEIIYYPPRWIKIYNLPYKLLYTCASIFN